jgi:hypothetical protein
MTKKMIMLLLLSCLSSCASAVNISVSVNGTVFALGETVMLHLEVNTTEPIGGQFVLYNEVEPKKYEIVRSYADFPDCAVCGGELPLSRPHSANYLFKPLSEGTYMAEAAFGGKAARVFFNVSRPTTTTVARLATTTTTSSTSTSAAATTTTTFLEEQSTQPQQPAQDNSLLYVGLLLPLAVAVWLLFFRRK